jgi:quinol monooxygenase YgiN
MLIAAGKLYVHPQQRDRWAAARDEITRIARSQPGCPGLPLSAGPLEEGRINLFEQGEPEAALRAWRAAADPRSPTSARASTSITSARPGPPFGRPMLQGSARHQPGEK